MARLRRTLTIRREDHIGDLLGLLFLDPGGENTEEVQRRLRDYLGRRMRLIRTSFGRDALKVEVELTAFPDEAGRMAEGAEALRLKGAKRAAMAGFNEALRLDPLNERALVGVATLYNDLKRHLDALKALRHAREVAGDAVRLLQALAQTCIAMERVPTAIGYLQRALDLAPDNPDIRASLKALGYEPLSHIRRHQALGGSGTKDHD